MSERTSCLKFQTSKMTTGNSQRNDALYAAQLGEMSAKAKPLHGLGGGVKEIAANNDESGTYRAVYTVSIGDAIYVIHAFQKKSKAGIATPKSEIELVQQRLKQLRSEVKNAEKKSS